MKRRTMLAIALCTAALVVSQTDALAGGGGGDRVKLIARLSPTDAGPAAASGKFVHETRNGQPKKLSVEAEDLFGLNGRTVSAFIGGRFVGSQRVALNSIDFELEAQLGDTVPPASVGQRVTLRIGSRVIMRGTFVALN